MPIYSYWLVVEPYPSENILTSVGDFIFPNVWKIKNVPMTTRLYPIYVEDCEKTWKQKHILWDTSALEISGFSHFNCYTESFIIACLVHLILAHVHMISHVSPCNCTDKKCGFRDVCRIFISIGWKWIEKELITKGRSRLPYFEWLKKPDMLFWHRLYLKKSF